MNNLRNKIDSWIRNAYHFLFTVRLLISTPMNPVQRICQHVSFDKQREPLALSGYSSQPGELVEIHLNPWIWFTWECVPAFLGSTFESGEPRWISRVLRTGRDGLFTYVTVLHSQRYGNVALFSYEPKDPCQYLSNFAPTLPPNQTKVNS